MTTEKIINNDQQEEEEASLKLSSYEWVGVVIIKLASICPSKIYYYSDKTYFYWYG